MYEWVYMPHSKPGIVQVYAHVHIYVHICVLTCMSCIEMHEWIYASFQGSIHIRTHVHIMYIYVYLVTCMSCIEMHE